MVRLSDLVFILNSQCRLYIFFLSKPMEKKNYHIENKFYFIVYITKVLCILLMNLVGLFHKENILI